MKILDLFCGLKGWSQAFIDRGHKVITVDIESKFNPTICEDIFAGSGTVGAVAKRLGRDYILIDIKPEYCEMARKRLASVESPLIK